MKNNSKPVPNRRKWLIQGKYKQVRVLGTRDTGYYHHGNSL